MPLRESFEELEVGDPIIFTPKSGWSYPRPRVEKITKVTKTQFTITSGARFNRLDGRHIPYSYSCPFVDLPKSLKQLNEVQEEYKKAVLELTFKAKVRWSELPIETLDQIKSMIPKEFIGPKDESNKNEFNPLAPKKSS